MTAGHYNWQAVAGNYKKALKIWSHMTRIMVRKGADPRISGLFFKTIVQAVLLFGLETWFLIPCMERALVSFQHRVARHITGRQLGRQGEGVWDYPQLAEAM